MKDARAALTNAQTELAAKQQELPRLKQTAADAVALHQQTENEKQTATALCSEVTTKVETAVRSGVDCIVTRNTKDYSKAPIPVYAPAEFIELLTETNEDQTD